MSPREAIQSSEDVNQTQNPVTWETVFPLKAQQSIMLDSDIRGIEWNKVECYFDVVRRPLWGFQPRYLSFMYWA